MMVAIRAKDTKPEMIIRRGLHALGLRYRLHAKDLPGKPDLVFRRQKAVIFVHGCFWHGHDCPAFKWPKTRAGFWRDKIGKNRANDAANADRLSALGYRCMTIWECALRRSDRAALGVVLEKCRDWIRHGTDDMTIGTE
jgi:DNA mismatch endonuclease (patch repair protein)